MNWILDFDDTLTVGPNTWALTVIIPEIVAANNLVFDPVRFTEITLRAQEIAGEASDDQVILEEMFRGLGWPTHLKQDLVARMYREYVPALYDDTLPFLEHLAAGSHTVWVISNNDYAPQVAKQLDIDRHFAGIFTPKRCNGAAYKPDREMWDFVISQGLADSDAPVTVVGDDPWSDGAFADACGHRCWILDRLGRYGSLRSRYPYHWAADLLSVAIE